ncbi:hypothetical protein [Methanobrevibacter sp.]|uniref:hypothetical protein n=1 Tax=Methanobrevibacter sp. TaxID=66852 RepID=UPI00388E0F8D
MNFKNIAILFFVFLSLILCIGSVSAENITEIDNSNATQEIATPTDEVKQPIENDQATSVSPKPTKKIVTDTDVDNVVVDYKKNNHVKVKVKNDKSNKAIKDLKLKIKIFTKTKSKTYTIKTGKNGIALFNTKKLGLGDHKVVITSADNKYKVSIKTHIFVGKKHTVTLKPNTSKKLKNKDTIKVYTVKDDNEKEVKVAFKGAAKKTKIAKAVFFLKNKKTGKITKKTDSTDFDDGKWQYPDEGYTNRYSLVKVKITYVTV